MKAAIPKRIINGVNVDQLFSTIDLIKEKPEIAKFKFRATNKWVGATHNRATVKDFYGAGQEDDTRESMVFHLDEPPVLLGKNEGANPVEYLLVALSGCLTTSLIAHGSAKGIKIRAVESRYEGDRDDSIGRRGSILFRYLYLPDFPGGVNGVFPVFPAHERSNLKPIVTLCP